MLCTGSSDEIKQDTEGVTQWLDAAREGNHELVTQLLRESPELVNTIDDDGLTALHHAALNGHLQVVELLLAANPLLVHRVDAQGRTALHIAAETNSFLIVEQLLQAGPCFDLIKAVDFTGRTALDYAITDSWEAVARILVEDPNLASQVYPWDGKTALHCAVRHGYNKGAARLLRENPNMIDSVDRFGVTVLHEAAEFGNPEMMALLLAAASPELINAVDKLGQNALHAAAHPEIVTQLLAASSGLICGVDKLGQTVLHRAAEIGCVESAAKLLAVQPELIDANHRGLTVLHHAVVWGRQAVAEMFLAVQPELVHVVSASGATVLHAASRQPTLSEEFIASLLELNPSALHVADDRGREPFAIAINQKNHAAIRGIQRKLVFDEVVCAFEARQMDHAKQFEFLSPVLREQYGCLLKPLNQDVVSFVYEYLGFKELSDVIVHTQ